MFTIYENQQKKDEPQIINTRQVIRTQDYKKAERTAYELYKHHKNINNTNHPYYYNTFIQIDT